MKQVRPFQSEYAKKSIDKQQYPFNIGTDINAL